MTTLPVPLTTVNESARRYAAASLSANTRLALDNDWRMFARWCASTKAHPVDPTAGAIMPVPPAVVAMYLSAMADEGFKASTIGRRRSSISTWHRAAGFDSPTRTDDVRRVMQGINNELGTATTKRVDVSPDDLRAYFANLNGTLRGARDKALLSVGFALGAQN